MKSEIIYFRIFKHKETKKRILRKRILRKRILKKSKYMNSNN